MTEKEVLLAALKREGIAYDVYNKDDDEIDELSTIETIVTVYNANDNYFFIDIKFREDGTLQTIEANE